MENKLISAEALNKAIRDDASIDGRNYARMKMHINEAQAVDAVEVVRCKDCTNFTPKGATYSWCDWWGVDPDEDDFCSHGERREGE